MTTIQNLQTFLETQFASLQKSPRYQKVQGLPSKQRYLAWAGIFLVAQAFIFGVLYLLFGKIVVIGLLASILAGLATGVGALPAIFFKDIKPQVFQSLLGAAAGIMLAATAFSLILPGMEIGDSLWTDKGLWVVSIGMIIGALFLHYTDEKLPHLHFETENKAKSDSLQKISLFIIAITIHNFPEGMAVGVSFGTGDLNRGLVLSIAIALQNIPEGLAVALPLVALGYNKWKAVGIATLTGLVEPIGGLLGITMASVFTPFLPIAMGFAAGAMLFVITEEIIPETHRQGRARHATFALMGGFILMMLLDNLLG
ncbi:MAG: ZIP family metal transporter [Methylococcales bacterium]|nr:ZIP family metal transporter [Methylococcales bacterium]